MLLPVLLCSAVCQTGSPCVCGVCGSVVPIFEFRNTRPRLPACPTVNFTLPSDCRLFTRGEGKRKHLTQSRPRACLLATVRSTHTMETEFFFSHSPSFGEAFPQPFFLLARALPPICSVLSTSHFQPTSRPCRDPVTFLCVPPLQVRLHLYKVQKQVSMSCPG